ncbi:STAS domain-containing protein [Actinoplanes sp. G11-F43]|uniref:STAS domain-containing protein n=1 Tax=Actinoplanes sp. G11-F43 TaxID=3424130 RepID=UPI003D3339CC
MTATVTGLPGSSAIRVSEHDGFAVVTVRGDIDRRLIPGLRDILSWAVDNHSGVVVDLAGATGIDRDGLALLLQTQDRAYLRHGEICFAQPSSRLLGALARLQADAMFPMVEDTPAALRHLRDGARV